jgi:hypothetical protein
MVRPFGLPIEIAKAAETGSAAEGISIGRCLFPRVAYRHCERSRGGAVLDRSPGCLHQSISHQMVSVLILRRRCRCSLRLRTAGTF